MHHLRKKKAMGLIAGQTDPVAITTLLLENEFTEEEASEVIASLNSTPGDLVNTGSGVGENNLSPVLPETNEQKKGELPAKVASPGKQSNYREYDLWQIDISRVEKTNPQNRQKYYAIDTFTCVKRVKSNVKLESQVVESLNAQSHNSGRRYYPSGTVTNGHTEKVDLSTII
jgi:hypothetical protein